MVKKNGTSKHLGKTVELIAIKRQNGDVRSEDIFEEKTQDVEEEKKNIGLVSVLVTPQDGKLPDRRILATSENGWTDKRFGYRVIGSPHVNCPLRFESNTSRGRVKGVFYGDICSIIDDLVFEEYESIKDAVTKLYETRELKVSTDEIAGLLQPYETSLLQQQRIMIAMGLECKLEKIGRIDPNETVKVIPARLLDRIKGNPRDAFRVFLRCLNLRAERRATSYILTVLDKAIQSLPNLNDPKSIANYISELKKQSSFFRPEEITQAVFELSERAENDSNANIKPSEDTDPRISKLVKIASNRKYINVIMGYIQLLGQLKCNYERKYGQNNIKTLEEVHLFSASHRI